MGELENRIYRLVERQWREDEPNECVQVALYSYESQYIV